MLMSDGSASAGCGACKFLRRRCAGAGADGCVFAPHFSYDQGAIHFAAVHKVFGASNASKLLLLVPPHRRHEAAATVSFEAQARVRDPVYGCVAHIFALQQQVASLQEEIELMTTQQFVNGTTTTTTSNDASSSHRIMESCFQICMQWESDYDGGGVGGDELTDSIMVMKNSTSTTATAAAVANSTSCCFQNFEGEGDSQLTSDHQVVLNHHHHQQQHQSMHMWGGGDRSEEWSTSY